jgi:hypothetical protein
MQTTCLFLLAAAIAQPNNVPPMFKTYAPAMTYYYKSPDASLGPKMLKDLLKEENIAHPFFVKNAHVLNIVAAQLGDIAAGKPEIVRQYEALLSTAPAAAGQKVIVTALMTCGDKETRKQIEGWTTDKRLIPLKSELEALDTHLADPKRNHVRDRPAKTPDDLDLLWSNFFITGEYAPISRILDVFDQPDAKENEVMKGVAKWSLGSNLQQHPKLVEIVEKNTKDRPEGSKKVIGELILKPPAQP